MKRLVPILLATFTALGASAFDDRFEEARTAYDQGLYAEAAQYYQTMLDDGIVNAEVHFNLANACYKAGDLPRAVWHYRKAWYTSPRDPDINANLSYALNTAGAVEPSPSRIARVFTALSQQEWGYDAIAGYLPLCALLFTGLLVRSARPAVLKLSLVPMAALLAAAGGWWQWRQFRERPEYVAVNSGVTALYAPVEGGTAYYTLPLAALVRQRNTDPKGWIEVDYDGKTGWVKTENLLLLSP